METGNCKKSPRRRNRSRSCRDRSPRRKNKIARPGTDLPVKKLLPLVRGQIYPSKNRSRSCGDKSPRRKNRPRLCGDRSPRRKNRSRSCGTDLPVEKIATTRAGTNLPVEKNRSRSFGDRSHRRKIAIRRKLSDESDPPNDPTETIPRSE